MEEPCTGKVLDSTSAFQLTGEPALVLNGVPDVNPGSDLSTQFTMPNDPDLNDAICLGEWMEGRKVNKLFGDAYYSGEVLKFDREMNWYRVVYEDGDFEDLDWHELEEILLPLDISIPLKKLALDVLKHANSVKKSGRKPGVSRKQDHLNFGIANHVVETPKRRYLRKNGKVDRTDHVLKKGSKKSRSAGKKWELLPNPERAKLKVETPDMVEGSHLMDVKIKEVDLQGSLDTELRKNCMEHHEILLDKRSTVSQSMVLGDKAATYLKKSGIMDSDPDMVGGSHLMDVEIVEMDHQGCLETKP